MWLTRWKCLFRGGKTSELSELVTQAGVAVKCVKVTVSIGQVDNNFAQFAFVHSKKCVDWQRQWQWLGWSRSILMELLANGVRSTHLCDECNWLQLNEITQSVKTTPSAAVQQQNLTVNQKQLYSVLSELSFSFGGLKRNDCRGNYRR